MSEDGKRLVEATDAELAALNVRINLGPARFGGSGYRWREFEFQRDQGGGIDVSFRDADHGYRPSDQWKVDAQSPFTLAAARDAAALVEIPRLFSYLWHGPRSDVLKRKMANAGAKPVLR